MEKTHYFISFLLIIVTFGIFALAGTCDHKDELIQQNLELTIAIENYNTLMRSIPDDTFLDVIVETEEYDYICYINSKYNLD